MKLGFLVLALLPAIVNAQFTYTVSNNAVTITAYTGPGGAVEIPSTIIGLPVVGIQHWAFDPYYTGDFASVTSVTIPDSITYIDYEAFEDCDLTNVTFGAGVTSIGSGAFTYCNALMAITANPNNPAFSTVNGVLFDKNQTTLIQCPQRLAGNYIIPDSVITVGWAAFYYCVGLTSVTIGNGVINIGLGAFQGCAGLTSLIIPNGVATISGAFAYCTGLTNVTIGHGVSSIGYNTFYHCTGLMSVSIPTNVTSIGSDAFDHCTSLPAIAIPASVTNIGAYAFKNCDLGNVTIPGSVISLGVGAFSYCLGLTNLTIANGVASIGANAFAGCPRLTSVLIPESVISIDAVPFPACTGLTAITVNPSNASYSSVDGVLFNRNQTILIQWPDGRGGSYTIPNSVTNIGAGAFQSCIILTNVTIDARLTGIGSSAFVGCTNLTAVYFSGNAPTAADSEVFGAGEQRDARAIAYHLPGTTGWSATFAGIPTALWHLPSPIMILSFEPAFGVRTNKFGFRVSWATNIPVVVEACTNLASPVWSSVATVTLANGSAYFSDAQWTNYADRFYRLRSP